MRHSCRIYQDAFSGLKRHHHTWPQIRTDILTKPMDLLMLNKLKESYCEIKVPPMGLFYPKLLVPDVYPSPPRSCFNDYEDMLEDTWQTEFPRTSDMSDGLFGGINVGLSLWKSYPVLATKLKREEKIGLAEAVTSSVPSTSHIALQRKLFCSIQLIGGVALTRGLIPPVEERTMFKS